MKTTRHVAVATAFVLLAGCAALREIGDAFRKDPATAVLAIVKVEVVAIRKNIFIPKDLASPTGLCEETACKQWRTIDAVITLAHNNAEQALTTVRDEQGRRTIALHLGRQTVKLVRDMGTIDVAHADTYTRAALAIEAVVAALGAIFPETPGPT